MLFIGINLLAVIITALLYTGKSFLLLILMFFGIFLGLTLLAVAFLGICCALVNKDKPQEHDSKFYRTLAHLYIDLAVTLGRVHIHTQGLEKTPKEGRFLLVCNHLNDIDPAVILKCFPKSQLAFISKKENTTMPFVGAVMHKIMCQLINRENDREALKTILKCVELIKNDQVSIGVFPEGYVSKTGKLQPLKGGVFKIAQKAKVPIVVCTIRDTKQALHKLLHLKASDVTLHLVEVIPAEALVGRTSVDIANQVFEMMLTDLGEDFRAEE